MKPLLTRAESREFDAQATESLGVAGLVLMENAGRGAFEALRRRFPSRLQRVVCVGGPGQNGGDAWVVARHLASAGFRPEAWMVGDVRALRGDARPNWDALASLHVSRQLVEPDIGELRAALEGASLVVDGVFGTGLDRPLEGLFAAVVGAMAAAPAPCVALDLPSGVDADTGAVLGVACAAELTLSFGAGKPGLYQHPGASLAGEVEIVPLGVPGPVDAALGVLEASELGRLIAPRVLDAHKGSVGHLLVVAGSAGKSGAAWLAARGGFRAGAGLVTLATRDPIPASLMSSLPEAMVEKLDGESPTERVRGLAETRGALVVGPGLGLDAVGRELCLSLASELSVPALLDADALTHVAAAGLECLRGAAGPRVLTPHPGEAARLLGCSSADIQARRLESALRLAERAGQVAVLKGAGSLVASSDGRALFCPYGTPAMATAGSGDVLAGAIGALMLSLPAFEAAAAGVLLHALAGERAAVSDGGLLAHELADAMPHVLAER